MKGFALRFVLKQSYKRTRKKKLMAYLIYMRLIRVSEEVLLILQSVRGQQICRKSSKQIINRLERIKIQVSFKLLLTWELTEAAQTMERLRAEISLSSLTEQKEKWISESSPG